MITKEDADNLLYESKEDLVDMLCTQSELIDDLYIKLKAKDEEIERLKAELEESNEIIDDYAEVQAQMTP